jgi:hypothetical protein
MLYICFVGACDGTGDNTIKHLYLPNEHWRGVFVEPLTMNVRDLIKFMSDNHANQRSLIIHAAATSECVKPTLVMERPLYEEKNASIPVRFWHNSVKFHIAARLLVCGAGLWRSEEVPAVLQRAGDAHSLPQFYTSFDAISPHASHSTGCGGRLARCSPRAAITRARSGRPRRCAA